MNCDKKTYGVGWRVEKVGALISSNSVVTSAGQKLAYNAGPDIEADRPVDTKVTGREIAVHAVLEAKDVLAVLDEFGDNLIPRPVSSVLVDVPT